MPEQENHLEGNHPPQGTGLRENILNLEIVMNGEVAMRDDEGGTTTPPNETSNLQKGENG